MRRHPDLGNGRIRTDDEFPGRLVELYGERAGIEIRLEAVLIRGRSELAVEIFESVVRPALKFLFVHLLIGCPSILTHLPPRWRHLLTLNGLDPTCIRQTTLPHTSQLFEDFTYRFDRVARFYGYNPQDPASLRNSAESIDFPADRRAALVKALRKQNGDSAALEALAQPGTVAVVTGQQVGLFSGPAYTIYKALTAAKMAERLTSQGIRAVPVFWLATEDHDLAEVDHAWTFDAEYRPVVLRAQAKVNGGQRPVGSITLDAVPNAELRECLRSFRDGEAVSAMVAESYAPGMEMGAAFRDLLKRVLSRFDLLYLDPLAEDIRAIGAPLLARAVKIAPELKRKLEERNRELIEAGYHAQVHIEPQTSLFFLLEGGRRIGLKVQNGEYVPARGTRYTSAQLAERAESLSPNALLRPVMQDYLLPTVAYIGGPAELAYLAQSEVLYGDLLGRMPVAASRSGFTLLDERARKLLTRYDLSWPVVYQGEEGIRDAIANRLTPPAVRTAFADASHETELALDRLARVLTGFDSTLAAALAKSQSKIAYQFSKMERKAAREAMRRDERAAGDAAFLAGLLYPNKHLQERLYTILPFLAKHGFELIDTLYEHIQLDCPDHQILIV
jgi:bacillithiol synthase